MALGPLRTAAAEADPRVTAVTGAGAATTGTRRQAQRFGRLGEGEAALRAHPRLAGAGVYLVGAVLLLLPVWLDPASRWAGPSGDSEQAVWFLAWTPHALLQGWNPLSTTAIGFPAGANLAWNMLMPLPGLLLAPVTLTLGPVVAYNTLITGAVVLCGVTAQAALRRHVTHPFAAIAGGALYAFGPFMLGQLAGHPNMVGAAALVPLVLMVVEDLVTGRSTAAHSGVRLGVLAAAELLVWEEALATTALAGAVLLGVLAASRPAGVRLPLARLARGLGIGVMVSLPVAVPFLAQQFLGAQVVHGGIQARGLFVTDLFNPVIPTRTALVSPAPLAAVSDGFTGNVLENGAYLGLPLLLVTAVTLRRWWVLVAVRAAGLTSAALLILSFGPSLHVAGHDTGIPLPWRVVQAVPLLGEMLPSRLAGYIDLGVALLLAVAIDRGVIGGGARRPLLSALTAIVVVATVLPLVPYPTTGAAVPAFFTSTALERIPAGSTALLLPFSHDPHSSTAMLWQAEAGFRFRMPEGYFTGPDTDGHALGGPPPSELGNDLVDIEARGSAGTTLDPVTIGRLRTQLRTWGVESIVVGPMAHRAETVAFLTVISGASPEEVRGVLLWARPAS